MQAIGQTAAQSAWPGNRLGGWLITLQTMALLTVALLTVALVPAGNSRAHSTASDLSRQLAGGQVVQWPDAGGRLHIELLQGQTKGGLQTVRTRKGARIDIELQADRAEEIHLHGYDITVRLKAGERKTLSLQATRSGRFELETHSTHKPVLVLEVLP